MKISQSDKSLFYFLLGFLFFLILSGMLIGFSSIESFGSYNSNMYDFAEINEPLSQLTEAQKNMLEKHSNHHSEKHMEEMKMNMMMGKSFSEAHSLAQAKVGN
uniref:Uncharacterized protein n=1 Tax=viral metagenome TaxID=1070528 RepID=A0A6C0AH66_9ZZZZ|tara:strand:- start:1165 stop:1473 length:309 start_codon:yes stop_codon:yes gene_type:complete